MIAFNPNRYLLEYLLFIVALINIILMTFYVYIKAFFPAVAFLKDIFLLTTLGLPILSIIANKGKINRLNLVDVMIGSLFLYLIFQFIYTMDKFDSFPATYYGFRLQFISITLYFLFKSIKNLTHKAIIHRTINTFLVLGCFLTLGEIVVVNSGILTIDQFLSLMGRGFLNEGGFMTSGFLWPRVMGISGTPQTTGVYNAILFGIVMYSSSVNVGGFPSYKLLPSIKQKIFSRKTGLILLAVISVGASTSKTAWTILLLIILLYPFTQQTVTLKIIIASLICVLVVVLFLIEFQSEQVFDSYLSFLSRYPIILYNKINEVMIKSPIIGFGFEVGEYSALLDLSTIPKENLVVNTELFLVRILRMLGFVGLAYYIVLFLLYPIYMLLKKETIKQKKYFIPILIIGISFGHYSPFESAPLCICAWYYLALISDELSIQKKNNNILLQSN